MLCNVPGEPGDKPNIMSKGHETMTLKSGGARFDNLKNNLTDTFGHYNE
jgi:hypothetical protein